MSFILTNANKCCQLCLTRDIISFILPANSRFYLKQYILRAWEHTPFFPQKWRDMASLKPYFLEWLLTDFPGKFTEDVKLMPDNVLKVLRRYLPSFMSYRDKSGGAESAPPPQAGRVNPCTESSGRCNRPFFFYEMNIGALGGSWWNFAQVMMYHSRNFCRKSWSQVMSRSYDITMEQLPIIFSSKTVFSSA